MQRQSLGSPISKLQIHGEIGTLNQDAKRMAPSSSSTESKFKETEKTQISSKTNRSIHFIPLLTLLCFLILYLFSHDPKGIEIGTHLDGFLDRDKIGEVIRSRRALKKADRRKMTSS